MKKVLIALLAVVALLVGVAQADPPTPVRLPPGQYMAFPQFPSAGPFDVWAYGIEEEPPYQQMFWGSGVPGQGGMYQWLYKGTTGSYNRPYSVPPDIRFFGPYGGEPLRWDYEIVNGSGQVIGSGVIFENNP